MEASLKNILSQTSLHPRNFAFDNGNIYYLAPASGESNALSLWTYHNETFEVMINADGEDSDTTLSLEEQLRRERSRTISTHGILEYAVHEGRVVINSGGAPFSFESGQVRKLPVTSGITDIRLGKEFLTYVRERNLFSWSFAAQAEIRWTNETDPERSCGTAEFIAQEELGRATGYAWSEDERFLAYTITDEVLVRKIQRTEYDSADHPVSVEQRYPFAGSENALVSLYVFDRRTNETCWVPFPETSREISEEYLARFKWINGLLWFQTLNRRQDQLVLKIFDPTSGNTREVLHEKQKPWINTHNVLQKLNGRGDFLWLSERDGFAHLYIMNAEGETLQQLTTGEWVVTNVRMVNQEHIYFEGTKDSPLEQHLYRIPVTGGTIERLTTLGMFHTTAVGAHAWIDTSSTPENPTKVDIKMAEGTTVPIPIACKHLLPTVTIPVEFHSIKLRDGTELYCQIRRPSPSNTPAPVVVYAYGGPHAQMVKKEFNTSAYWEEYLVKKGFVVITVDNRGSSNRGLAFEGAIHRRFGELEVDDQVAAIEWLKQFPWADTSRVGIFGWSFGGYLTLRSLILRPDIFAAGVAVAPVTDWSLYDTAYTERYLQLPEENPEGYLNSSCIPLAAKLTHPLLLIHGEADDNVLIANSNRFLRTLQKVDGNCTFMLYPGERHGITGSRASVLNKMMEFFETHLSNQNVPKL